MELKTIVTDVFLYVATIRDRMEKGLTPSVDEVLAEVRTLFQTIDQKVLADSALKSRFDRIRFGLVALVRPFLALQVRLGPGGLALGDSGAQLADHDRVIGGRVVEKGRETLVVSE